MNYDPIKRSLGNVFNSSPVLRKLFYILLDILLLRAWHIKKQIRIWSKSAPKDAQIIDAGAGFGQYVYFMSSLQSQWKITGIDLKSEQVADCNAFFTQIERNKQVLYVEGDLTSYIAEKPANLILCVDVMEHILEDVTVFKNFYASLQSGGMVLISTPSDQGGSDVHEDDDHSFVGEHVRDGYNIDEIKVKLQSAGFTSVESYYSYGTPGKISWKLSMKFPILMVNLTSISFLILPFYYLIVFPWCLVLNYFDLIGKHKSGTGLIVKAFKA